MKRRPKRAAIKADVAAAVADHGNLKLGAAKSRLTASIKHDFLDKTADGDSFRIIRNKTIEVHNIYNHKGRFR